MKKGFTLIELLAVILILGIIAVIAVPRVTNMIEESRTNSAGLTAKYYLDAVNNKVALSKLDSDSNNDVRDDIYTVESIGEVKINGEAPTSGTFKIENGSVKEANLIVSGYNVSCYSKGKCIASSGNISFVYYQEVGPGLTKVNDITERPTTYKTYLKYPVVNNELVTPQVCIFEGTELCLSHNEFNVSQAAIKEYFGYVSGLGDDGWIALQQGSNKYYKPDSSMKIACTIESDHIDCYDNNTGIEVTASQDGSVTASDGSLSCDIDNTGTPFCMD